MGHGEESRRGNIDTGEDIVKALWEIADQLRQLNRHIALLTQGIPPKPWPTGKVNCMKFV
jgi:hypothetical protein